jgi:voltage-gated sodium channel
MNRNPKTNAVIMVPVYDEDPASKTAAARFALRDFFGTKKYEYGTTAVILFNGFFIWSEIDQPTKYNYAMINLVFSVVYVFELSCKMYAFGRYFWFSNWNVFDFLVTGITILSDFAEYVVDGQTAKNMRTLAPVIRLLRLLRLTNMFAGLRSLAGAFIGSLGALGWIMVFVMIWFFICSCLTTILIGRKDFFPDSSTSNPADAPRIRNMFRTVPCSMYTLFEVMSMEGWVGVVRPISRTQPALVFFFFVFIFIAAFFLLNLVTAVVVDRTVQAQEEGEKAASAVDNDDKEVGIFEFIEQMKEANNNDNYMSRKALAVALELEGIDEKLYDFDWKAQTVKDVCSVLDRDNTGFVDLRALQQAIGEATQPIEMITWVRMQAQMSQRLEKNEQILMNLGK